MAPLVSVCIPAYNHERFISACVESVLAQSLHEVEIIVVDDASSDGTHHALRRVNDERLKVYRHDRNLGPSAAINDAVARSSGRYIALLGSDDLFLPGKLEAQVAFAESHPQVQAVFGFAHAIDEKGARLPDGNEPLPALFRQDNRSRAQWLRRFFFQGNCLCAPTVLLRRTAVQDIGEHDPRLLQLQDLDYWIRIVLRGEIHVMPRPLIDYRVGSGGNISAWRPENITRLRWETAKVLRRFLALQDRRLFAETFPESTQIEGHEELPLSLLLGLAAMTAADPGVRLFGIDVLFDAFESDAQRLRLAARGVHPAMLFDAVRSADPFGLLGGAPVRETLNALRLSILRALRARTTSRTGRPPPASEK